MIASRASRSPIVEFLGEDAGAGGPFALLGLPHEIGSDEQIIRACHRRLHQIDRHRHRSTPDAGEVRLAVHAAASQLLDPKLRAELARRWPAGTPVAVPKAWKPSQQTSRLTPGFVQSAKLLIAASGGWNATARKRLAHFARVNRVGALELISALSPRVQREPASPAALSPEASLRFDERVYLIDPPPTRSFDWFAAYGLLAVLAGALVLAAVLVPMRVDPAGGVGASPARADADVDGAGQGAASAGKAAPELLGDRTDLTHYTAIAHELDQLARRAQSDMEPSVERFGQVYPEFVTGWVAFPAPALERTGLHIAEFVRGVSGSGASLDALLPILGCDGNETSPSQAMIRAAVIDVVRSEPGLSPQARDRLGVIRKRCSGSESRATSSILAALVPIAGLIGVDARTDDPAWWKDWIQGVRAATFEDESQRTRLVLSALSSRLRDPAPSSPSWNQSGIELVSAVPWRAGSPARAWLLGQFADPAVSTPRLAAITEAIATHSGAQQVNAQMVLNPSATFSQRQQLAETYRSAWTASVPGGNSGAVPGADQFPELVNELRLRVSITPMQMDQQQAIKAIVELARLNAAAWQFAQGKDAIAADTLAGAKGKIASASDPELFVLTTNQRDSKWAQQAMNAQDAGELSALFAQLVSDDGPGVNSAHALVFLATLHADAQIRSSASAQIIRYQDHPSVLLALDHVVANKRISARLEQLVAAVVGDELPSRTDDSWYLAAHRALLARLTRSLARGVESDLSVLEHELDLGYAGRIGDGAALGSGSQGASVHAARLFRQLMLDAGSGGDSAAGGGRVEQRDLARVESATDVRLARAKRPLDEFFAYQRGVCELLGLVTRRDVPGSSLRVGDLLAELEDRLGRSGSAADQIAQVERCIAELWIVRLEGKSP